MPFLSPIVYRRTSCFRSQRHRDISDGRWLILYKGCCQRLLHLVSYHDVVTIEGLVHCLDQQSRDNSSLCRWEHQLADSIDLIDFLHLDHQQLLFHYLHQSSIRQCDDFTSRQWQCFDCQHRCLIHRASRVDWCHHHTHFRQPLSLISVTIVRLSINWAYLQWREVIVPLCREHPHLDREYLHPVSGHFRSVIHFRIINWRENFGYLEINETACHNFLEKCLRRIGTLFKRYIKKYFSMKVKIYRQRSKYTVHIDYSLAL